MPGTNSFVTANNVETSDVPATTMTGQTVACEVATFNLGPRSLVGFGPSRWRQHPRTTSGRTIKAR